jgi:hypothetical protein
MLDEENGSRPSREKSRDFSRSSTVPTDDESHIIKRRASPTELPREAGSAQTAAEMEQAVPDNGAANAAGTGVASGDGKGSGSLSKRASFKKMRPAGNLGLISGSSGDEYGTASGSGGSVRSPGRVRRGGSR